MQDNQEPTIDETIIIPDGTEGGADPEPIFEPEPIATSETVYQFDMHDLAGILKHVPGLCQARGCSFRENAMQHKVWVGVPDGCELPRELVGLPHSILGKVKAPKVQKDIDLGSLDMKQLKEIAKARGVKVKVGMSLVQLREALK